MSLLSDENGADLKQLFFESAQELLQALNEEGLRLEKNPGDTEVVRSVRRILHTLKGDSAACGYHELSELAHAAEDVVTPERAQAGAVRLAGLVLSAADVFAVMLAAYRNSNPLPSVEGLRRAIADITSQEQAESTSSSPANVTQPIHFGWTEYEEMVIANASSHGCKVLQVRVEFDQACTARTAAYQLVRKALEEQGEILVIHPEAASTEAISMIDAAIATQADAAVISRKCQIPDLVARVVVVPRKCSGLEPAEPGHAISKTEISAAEPPNTDAGSEVVAKSEGSAQAAENTLRVDSERIDKVLNLVGELIIGKSMLHQTLTEFDKQYPKDPLRGRFSDAMAFQARVLTDLQKSVMKIRMVPVEQLFRRFPRLVRDLAKTCGREVLLAISGEDTELDKSILDVLAEPLTHLIRNAVDHGIEPREERARAGKPPNGTIRLNAFHQGNQMVIEVSDDGRGIDRQKVIARALERKVISADEVAQMGEGEAVALIFHSGLSTAEEVTSISGRGVGMDVVKTVLDRLKGSVQIETEAGRGTTFYLKVPLTLAIIKALLFCVGGRLYAVPLASVLEITRTQEGDFHQVEQHEVVQLRDEVLTLVRLDRLDRNTSRGAAEKVFVIVIHVGERKFGLVVDKLVGEEELVIKALSDRLVATELVSGASILGDGTVVLILNLAAVVSRLGKVEHNAGVLRAPALHKEVRA